MFVSISSQDITSSLTLTNGKRSEHRHVAEQEGEFKTGTIRFSISLGPRSKLHMALLLLEST